MRNDALLYLAIIISLFTYLFWDLMPKGSFYVGNALFILTLSIYIFISKNNFASFLLLSFSINNLLDELFYNPKELQLNELLTAITILVFAYFKYCNGRKRT